MTRKPGFKRPGHRSHTRFRRMLQNKRFVKRLEQDEKRLIRKYVTAKKEGDLCAS